MADVLTEIGGVKLTIRTVGIITAVLVLILFTLLRKAMNKKSAAKARALVSWLDEIGFALLPAAAVWKIYAVTGAGAGREIIEPLPLIPGLTENGRFIPENIEAAAALICFGGICIWLMIRKDGPEGTGDLLIVSLCLWSGIRIVTESFREPPNNVFRYVYCAVIFACLIYWSLRRSQDTAMQRRMIFDWVAAGICTAMIVLTASGTLSVGSPIGDLAVVFGCSVLLMTVTLLCGGDQRNTAFRNQNSES